MLPIKHSKEPIGKGLEAHPTAFSMQHLGLQFKVCILNFILAISING
jgi:hypothetical protein